jgi:hypothetical protein
VSPDACDDAIPPAAADLDNAPSDPASTAEPYAIPATGSPACSAGETTGPTGENVFLRTWVPRIQRSAAYRNDGVLVIALAGAEPGHPYPTGALVISRHTQPKHTIAARYTPYSLLRSIEDMLGYTPLGRAGRAPSFARQTL